MQRLIGSGAADAIDRQERAMKLADLFSRARRRANYPDEIEAPARRGKDPGHGAADRSSMADLVRLLKEADDAQKVSGTRPA